MRINNIGDGNVVLIAGGGKCYTDIAARFVGSEKKLEDILASPYDAKIVKNILNRGHLAATEFDNFIFGIEGYARVTEIQLVRKRLASYLIKSGRKEKEGKRSFDIVLPYSVRNVESYGPLYDNLFLKNEDEYSPLSSDNIYLKVNSFNLLEWTEEWYNHGIDIGVPEEDLRYMKQQATEFKAIISMNAHGLIDWLKIRCCLNAQTEIRDLATKMLRLCKQSSPDLFVNAGASCVALGYCPENGGQNKMCKKIKHSEVLELIKSRNTGV